MPYPILKQAVVIGAGMGGLAAAKAVAPHFETCLGNIQTTPIGADQ
jgi:hypothetical protein